MAQPQLENGYIRLANDIHEQIMVSYFTERQYRILEFIIRLSYGCQKKEAYIPKQSEFEMVGVGAGHIKNQLDLLIRDKVITREGDLYSINKDYDQWRVSRAKPYDPAKLTDLVRINLKKSYLIGNERLPKGEAEVTEKGTSSTLYKKHIKNNIKKDDDPSKFLTGKYGHLVQH